MKVKRPKKWKIEIWEDEDGNWHEEYIELFPDTEENRGAIKLTIDIINRTLGKTGFIDFDCKEIEEEGMIGIIITSISKNLVPIANQLLSEFVIMSEVGDITLREMFVILIQSFAFKDKIMEETMKMSDFLNSKELEE